MQLETTTNLTPAPPDHFGSSGLPFFYPPASVDHASSPATQDHTLSLPPEILAYIFWLATGPEQCFLETKDPPWSTSHVCRRWCEISRSSAYLWTDIHVLGLKGGSHWFRLEDLVGKKAKAAVSTILAQRLSRQLQYARGLPLTIRRVTRLIGPLEDTMMDILWDHRTSWQHFEYDLTPLIFDSEGHQVGVRPVRAWVRAAEESIEGHILFPTLQQLTLRARACGTWLQQEASRLLAMFQGNAAPILTSLTVYMQILVPYELNTIIDNTLDLPWHQLTNLTLYGCTLEEEHFPRFFSGLISLRSLSLLLTTESSQQPVTAITLPLLVQLTLPVTTRYNHLDATIILPWLSAPSLRQLNIEGSFSSPVLISFVKRSRCNIQLFQATHFSDSIGFEFLHVMAHLKELRIHAIQASFIFDTISFLLGNGTYPAPCSHLGRVDLWAEPLFPNFRVDDNGPHSGEVDTRIFSSGQLDQIAEFLERRGTHIPQDLIEQGVCSRLKEMNVTLACETFGIVEVEEGDLEWIDEEERRLRLEARERIDQVVRDGMKVAICRVDGE
jgi:hypothetical protein